MNVSTALLGKAQALGERHPVPFTLFRLGPRHPIPIPGGEVTMSCFTLETNVPQRHPVSLQGGPGFFSPLHITPRRSPECLFPQVSAPTLPHAGVLSILVLPVACAMPEMIAFLALLL